MANVRVLSMLLGVNVRIARFNKLVATLMCRKPIALAIYPKILKTVIDILLPVLTAAMAATTSK